MYVYHDVWPAHPRNIKVHDPHSPKAIANAVLDRRKALRVKIPFERNDDPLLAGLLVTLLERGPLLPDTVVGCLCLWQIGR